MHLPRFALALAAAAALHAISGCASIALDDPYAQAPISRQLAEADGAGADGAGADGGQDPARECAAFFAAADAHIDGAGVRDGLSVRVPGYPYLRVDRLAVALARRASPPPRAAWIDYAAALDTEARRAESANAAQAFDETAAARCRAVLLAAKTSAADPMAAAQVPDDYRTTWRVLGLYPLTRLAFASGIRGWHAQVRESFATPVQTLPARGPRVLYAHGAIDTLSPDTLSPDTTSPDTTSPPAGWVAPQTARELGLPALSAAQAWTLLARFAPQISVETVTDDDRLGRLTWTTHGRVDRIGVDTRNAVVTARLAYALLDGHAHLQLAYTYWFPARAATGAIDVLAGPLDGLIWRITLDRDARAPLVHDTIHACGCYHLFFPTARVTARPPAPDQGRFDEGLFAPQLAPELGGGERLRILLEARTHYVQRLVVAPDAAPAEESTYRLASDDTLRALPRPGGGTRSAFDPSGLVPGSERLERFFFWPMGIESAGQMRQWGRHATAFVGRRHFDDPLLLDRYFKVAY